MEVDHVPAGIYNIIPTTFLPKQEGPFFLDFASTLSLKVSQLQWRWAESGAWFGRERSREVSETVRCVWRGRDKMQRVWNATSWILEAPTRWNITVKVENLRTGFMKRKFTMESKLSTFYTFKKVRQSASRWKARKGAASLFAILKTASVELSSPNGNAHNTV